MNMRRQQRIRSDLEALSALARGRPNFSWQRFGRGIRFRYAPVPGLLQTGQGVAVYERWQATIFLPPRYPIDGPVVTLSSLAQKGTPFHPNVSPEPPYLVCYGRHLPVLLLDELARRLERMIVLMPGAVMTDERDSLNTAACAYVRRLAREGATPLRLDEGAPQQPSQVTTTGV